MCVCGYASTLGFCLYTLLSSPLTYEHSTCLSPEPHNPSPALHERSRPLLCHTHRLASVSVRSTKRTITTVAGQHTTHVQKHTIGHCNNYACTVRMYLQHMYMYSTHTYVRMYRHTYTHTVIVFPTLQKHRCRSYIENCQSRCFVS